MVCFFEWEIGNGNCIEHFNPLVTCHASRFIVICQGRVHLKNPDRNFWLMETDGHGAHNGLPPVVQRRIFFGRQVGGADRKLLPTYPLKSRKYLGPATLNAEMAFLMANQAQVTPRKVVYDPFVGSGSILIVAAHFGAITMVCVLLPFSFMLIYFPSATYLTKLKHLFAASSNINRCKSFRELTLI